jgi:CDP-ribitol ribitolphosphotransferase
MGALKKRVTKIFPKNFRKYFIRKVTLRDVTPFDTYLSITLTLKNFINVNHLKITLTNNEYSYSLPYRLNAQTLRVEIPFNIINHTIGASKIFVTVNGKNMIVRQSPALSFDHSSFFSEGRLLNISAQGSLVLKHLFADYSFSNKVLKVTDTDTAYNHLAFTFKDIKNTEGMNIALLYAHKIVELNNISGKENYFSVTDFEDITMGNARVYAVKDDILFPISFKNNIQFDTPYYRVKLNYEKKRLIANVHPHTITLTQFDSEIVEDKAHLTIDYNGKFTMQSFIVVDTLTQSTTAFPVEINNNNKYETRIPIDVLIDTFSRKKFIIYSEKTHPFYIQPSIDNLENLGFNDRIRVLFHHEIVKIWFYKRKDNLLGFKITRPKVRRLITDIESHVVEGFINGLDEFVDCTTYLVFEERYTSVSERFEVNDIFKVNLQDIDLLNIKSKGKTILDFFIEIVGPDGEVIRKGKVKYQHSDYKKDNYYDKYQIIDSEGNLHHQLVTTTPYDNLKVETFMIPATIAGGDINTVKDMNTWLLGERYDTAQDNGYAMFQWLKDNTNVSAWYVIEEDSKDYLKIKDEEHVLVFGSEEHFLISFKAGVLLGTHDLENLLPYKPARGFYRYENTVKVFLQHGVLGRKPAEYDKKYYDLPFDLFIVSSIAEKEKIVMHKMGYEENEVAVTGLARFDNLPFNHPTKDILLMPTWRDWINSDEAFLESVYYYRYMNLIHNPRLTHILEKYNITLDFYPHYRAQVYFNNDHLEVSDHIRFIELGDETVQDLLINHSLLVTDYSSVSFDFTLMNKPVIYYHFDVKRFFKKGKLRPIYETFIGDIAKQEEELIDLIEESIDSHFMNNYNDVSGIFEYQDHQNRERIYNAVLDKIKRS